MASPNSRQFLERRLSEMNPQQPFGNFVRSINQMFMQRGDNTLPQEHAQLYVDLSQGVEQGGSHSFAFGRSAMQWAKERNPLGVGMNVLGFLWSGGYDSTQEKRSRYVPKP